MTKLILLSFLFLFLVSCNETPCENPTGSVQKTEAQAACPVPVPSPSPEPTPPETPSEPGGEVPTDALTFNASADLYEFEAEDEAKLYQALDIIKKVIASSEFRDKVLNYTYQGKKQFVDNKGLSNAEIYQVLLDGKEILKPEVDNEMDLELQLYYSWRSTVGYTTPGAMRIYLNTKFFDPYTPSEVAGNVFHEWTHKLGFEHASSYSIERDSTVPYAIGYMIRELGKKYE